MMWEPIFDFQRCRIHTGSAPKVSIVTARLLQRRFVRRRRCDDYAIRCVCSRTRTRHIALTPLELFIGIKIER